MSTTLSSITTLINDRRRDTGAGSIDMTTVGFRAINSTLSIWNEIHDWPWTIKKIQFNYNPGVDTYALDSIVGDFKYPLTLKFYKPNNKTAEFWMVSPLRFDSAYLFARRFAIDVSAGIQTIRITSPDGNASSLNTATAYNQNGLWVGASAISGVGTDNYEGYDFSSSVSFNFNGTSGTLTNSTQSAVDMSLFYNRSSLYVNVDIPSITNLQSFTLSWGTNSSNYYTVTVTTDYLGDAFAIGWTKLKFLWNSVTTVGTPTITSIGWVQFTVTCSGSTNLGEFRIQNFFVSENIPLLLTYYSTSMVEAASGGAQTQTFTNEANTSDFPLWSGRWDVATEPFINACLEIVFWITGEQTDYQIAQAKVLEIVEPLKRRYPTQRRYPTMQIIPDINFQGEGNAGRAPWYPNSFDSSF